MTQTIDTITIQDSDYAPVAFGSKPIRDAKLRIASSGSITANKALLTELGVPETAEKCKLKVYISDTGGVLIKQGTDDDYNVSMHRPKNMQFAMQGRSFSIRRAAVEKMPTGGTLYVNFNDTPAGENQAVGTLSLKSE